MISELGLLYSRLGQEPRQPQVDSETLPTSWQRPLVTNLPKRSCNQRNTSRRINPKAASQAPSSFLLRLSSGSFGKELAPNIEIPLDPAIPIVPRPVPFSDRGQVSRIRSHAPLRTRAIDAGYGIQGRCWVRHHGDANGSSVSSVWQEGMSPH